MTIHFCPEGHQWEGQETTANAGTASTGCPVCDSTANVPPTVRPSAIPPASTPDAEPVPGYEMLAKLGQGGMGVVYQARHLASGRLVAIKRMLAPLEAAWAADVIRFRAEAEALARLRHPNVVELIEAGDHEGRPFFVMELVTGGSLDRRLTGEPLPPREAAVLVETLARAAHAAHQTGVVHRDLKPANVLLAGDAGEGASLAGCVPKLTDFGLAKRLDASTVLTSTGAVLGTPSYMAPEQAEGKKDVGPATDVWALGVILYQCVTGRLPFVAPTLLQILELVRTQDPAPPRSFTPAVPRDLETICLKCLHKDPARRYASADDLADDLRRFVEDRPIRARRVGLAERAVKWRRRNPTLAATFAVTALLLAAAGLAALGYWDRFRRVKYVHFAAAVECRGEPVGVGRLEAAEVRRRASSYRFAVRGGRVEEVAVVNGSGTLVPDPAPHSLKPESADDPPGPCRYVYRRDDRGKLLEKTAHDRADNVAWSLRYTSETAGHYLDPRGFVRAPAGVGTSHFVTTHDEAGFVREIHHVDAAGQPRPDHEGVFGRRFQREANGLVAEVTFLGRDRNPTVNKRKRFAKAKFERDELGDLIRIGFFDADDRPALSRAGFAVWQGWRGEGGNLTEERFLDAEGRPVLIRGGYAQRRSTFDGRGNRTEHLLLGVEGRPVVCRDGYARHQATHDERGWLLEERFFDADDRPAIGRSGYHRRTQKPDERGFVLEEAYFGADDRPVMARDGVARVTTRYDERGNPIEVSYFGTDGQPTVHPDGSARHTAQYDAHGACVGATCFGPDGAPGYWKNGYSRWSATYDERGNRTEWACFDVGGGPVHCSDGYARQTARFDEWGVVEEAYFGAGADLVAGPGGYARRTVRHDDRGNVIEEALFGSKGQPVVGKDGHARLVAVFDALGNRTQVTYYSDENKPAPNVNGVTQIRTTYDAQGNPVQELFCDGEGRPTLSKHGVAGVTNSYNHAGDLIEEVCLGIDGKPAAGASAFVRRLAAYDARGNVIEQRYFDAAGKPAPCRDGYARQTRQFDESGNVVAEAYFDAQNRPVARKDGIAVVRQRYDARGRSVDARYFGPDGRPVACADGYAREATTFDASGDEIGVAYWGVDGRAVACANGYHRTRVAYDERHRPVELGFYGTDGKLVAAEDGYARLTHRFDEQGELVKLRYYAPDGKPAANREGVIGIDSRLDERHRKLEARMLTTTGSHVQTYDDRGRLVQLAWFDREGRPVVGPHGYARGTIHFDAAGRQAGFAFFGPDGRPMPGTNGFLRLDRTFDAKGRLSEETGDLGRWRIVLRYNPSGNVAGASYFGPDGKPAVNDEGYSRTEKKYDDRGNAIEHLFFGTDDKPTLHRNGYASISYRYDKTGNQIETTYLDKDGQPTNSKSGFARHRRKFEGTRLVEEEIYDARGRLLGRIQHDKTGVRKSVVLDGLGRPARTSWYSADGKLSARTEGYAGYNSRYDESGEETERQFFGADGKPVRTRVVIGEVAAKGVAERLGLRRGDVIEKYDGQAVTFAAALLRRLKKQKTSAAPLVVLRGGKPVAVEVPPGSLGAELLDVAAR